MLTTLKLNAWFKKKRDYLYVLRKTQASLDYERDDMDKLHLLSLEKLRDIEFLEGQMVIQDIIREKHWELENIQSLIKNKMNEMNKLLVKQYMIHNKLIKLQELINENMEQLKESNDTPLNDFVNCFGS